MENKINCILGMLIFMILLTGCQQIVAKETGEIDTLAIKEGESILDHNIEDEINNYMSRFMTAYLNDDELKIEKRQLLSGSTEGGVITRYQNSNQEVIRFTTINYGEMGCVTSEYYFINNYIYHSKLVEYYSCPIYLKEAEVLYRKFDELIILGGKYYQRDKVNGGFHLNTMSEVEYDSLDKLEEVFNQSEIPVGVNSRRTKTALQASLTAVIVRRFPTVLNCYI